MNNFNSIIYCIHLATLGRNFANGIDLSDVRSSAALLPEDIIDKYREAVQQYAKVRCSTILIISC